MPAREDEGFVYEEEGVFLESDIQYVNVDTYTAADVNLTDFQILEIARDACRSGDAFITTRDQSLERPLVYTVQIRIEDWVETVEDIFDEAASVIQFLMNDEPWVDRDEFFRGVPGTGY